MAPVRGDDLSELNPMDYGKFVYLYYLGFNCPVEKDIVDNISHWMQGRGDYSVEGELTSDFTLILSSDEDIDKRVFSFFPGCGELNCLEKFVAEFVNK